MCQSMVNIQFPTAEIRRGKKRRRKKKEEETRMWANDQRDGRPAEYRWPSVQCHKVWLTPTSRVCSNPAKMRNPWKFAGVPQTGKPISAISGPMFTILSEHVEEVLAFNKFFSGCRCLSSEYIARQSCAMVPKWRFFCKLYFQRAACTTFHTCILNSH